MAFYIAYGSQGGRWKRYSPGILDVRSIMPVLKGRWLYLQVDNLSVNIRSHSSSPQPPQKIVGVLNSAKKQKKAGSGEQR